MGGQGGRVGGRGGRLGGQGTCEHRGKVFVKIQKKIYIFFFLEGGGRARVGGGGWVWGVRVVVNEELKFL